MSGDFSFRCRTCGRSVRETRFGWGHEGLAYFGHRARPAPSGGDEPGGLPPASARLRRSRPAPIEDKRAGAG